MGDGKRNPGLTARFVEAVKPGPRTRLYCDGNGLYLVVQPTGSKQWVQRLVIGGHRRELGLGGYPLTSLKEARDVAFANRKLARAGGDPLARKRAERAPSFEEATEAVIALRRDGWRDGRSEAQWRASLAEYVFPTLGARPVTEIDTAAVMDVLAPIWSTKPTDGPAGAPTHRRGDAVGDREGPPDGQPGRRRRRRGAAEGRQREAAPVIGT